MRRLVLTVIMLLMLSGSALAQATYYYVSTTGSDSNNGLSPTTPFRTIQKGVNQIGTLPVTVYVNTGFYPENVIITTQGPTVAPLSLLTCYGGTVSVTGITITQPGWTVDPCMAPGGFAPPGLTVSTDGVTITGNGLPSNPLTAHGGGGTVQSDNVTIQGNGTAGSAIAIKAVQTDGTTITGNGTVGNPLVAAGGNSGVGGTKNSNPGTDKVINVLNYGAKGDGTTDDTAAIVGAITASCNTTGPAPNNGNAHPVLFFPCGKYKISSPLTITCQLKFQGEDEFCSGLEVPGGFDPFPMVTYLQTTGSNRYLFGVTTTAAPLVSGSTYSMNWPLNTGSLGYYYNLKEASIGTTTASKVAPLAGLAAFEFDAQVNFAAGGTNAHSYYLTDSAEQYLNPPTYGYGIGVQHDMTIWVVQQTTNSDLHAILNLTGGSVSLTATAALSNAATHHVALSYDGSTVRLFVDGVAVASGAGTGTVVQPGGSSWLLGDAFNGDLAAYGQTANWIGQAQCVRVSNVARFTGTFTPPTACPAKDANTLLLLGPSNFNGVFQQVASVSNGLAGTGVYLFPYWEGLQSNSGDYGEFNDMTLSGGTIGLLVPTTQNMWFRNLSVYASQVGVKLWNYAYTNHFRNISPTGAEAGLEILDNSSGDVNGYLQLGTADFGIVYALSSGGTIYNGFIQIGGQNVTGIAAIGGNTTFINFLEDAELPGTTATGAIVGGGNIQFIGSTIESYGGTCNVQTVEVVSPTNQVVFTNTNLTICTTSSSPVVHIDNDSAQVIYDHSLVNGVPAAKSNTTPTALTNFSESTTVDGAARSGTVAQLPANPRASAVFDVTDCNACTFGATCTHSASPPVPLCPEKWNGSAWAVY